MALGKKIQNRLRPFPRSPSTIGRVIHPIIGRMNHMTFALGYGLETWTTSTDKSKQAMAVSTFPSGHHFLAASSACINPNMTSLLLAQRRAFCQCLCAADGSSSVVLNTRSSLSFQSHPHHLHFPHRGTWLQTSRLSAYECSAKQQQDQDWGQVTFTLYILGSPCALGSM